MNIYHLGIDMKLTKLSNLDVISKRRLRISRSKIFLATQSDHSLYIPSVPRYLRTAFSGSRKSFNLPCFDKEGSAWSLSLSLSLASSLSLTSLPPLPTRYFWTACFRFRFWKMRFFVHISKAMKSSPLLDHLVIQNSGDFLCWKYR